MGPPAADTRLVKVSHSRLVVARNNRKLILAFVLFFPISFALYTLIPALFGVGKLAVVALLFPVLLFAILLFGSYILSLANIAVIDKASGVKLRSCDQGASATGGNLPTRRFDLSRITQVQLIEKSVPDSDAVCHELNLLLEDGGRINLMNHGDGLELVRNAQTTAEFLQVPLSTHIHTSAARKP